MEWEVDVDVVPGVPDEETGKNNGGIVIYLKRDETNFVEVCRVAFVRRESANAKKGFRAVLKQKLEDATAAKNALNKVDIDIQETQDRLDDLLDRAEAERDAVLKGFKDQGAV